MKAASSAEIRSIGQREMGSPRGRQAQVRPRLALKVMVHGCMRPYRTRGAPRGHSKSACIKIHSAAQLRFLEGPAPQEAAALFLGDLQAHAQLAGPPRARAVCSQTLHLWD